MSAECRVVFFKLACFIVLVLVIMLVGSAITDQPDQELDQIRKNISWPGHVSNLLQNYSSTTSQSDSNIQIVTKGTIFELEQENATYGFGFANTRADYNIFQTNENQGLHQRSRISGSGYISLDPYTYFSNGIEETELGDYVGSNSIIWSKDVGPLRADYHDVTLFNGIKGSFRSKKPVSSPWKVQDLDENHAGDISMDYSFENVRTNITKESENKMISDTLVYPFVPSDANIDSKMTVLANLYNGTGHLGTEVGINQVKSSRRSSTLLDEDYKGSFYIKNSMNFSIYERLNQSGQDEYNPNGYEWLPCLSCQQGWNIMTIHDQRYHSAEGFFDCTTCPNCGPAHKHATLPQPSPIMQRERIGASLPTKPSKCFSLGTAL